MNHDPIQDLLRDGYAVVAGAVSSSRDQRRLMVELAGRFDEPTVPAALMRFDQQQTTRWHIDGGPDRGVLMLGYEPTVVRVRVMLASLERLAQHLNVAHDEAAHQAQRGLHDEWIAESAIELALDFDAYPIVLVNNSATAEGMLHRAEILEPDPSAKRVVNSALFGLGHEDAEAFERETKAFIETHEVLT